MDTMVAKKMKTEIRIGTVLVALSLILFIAVIFILRINSTLNEKSVLAEIQVAKYRTTIGPDAKYLIQSQKAGKYKLDQVYAELKKTLGNSSVEADLTADTLSFKKLLLDVHGRLAAKAKSCNVSLPEDLGFIDYSLKLPDISQVPVLMKELIFLDDIGSLLIKNKIYVLKSINLPHKAASIDKKIQSAGMSFRSLSMQLSMETDFKQLKSFLMDLAASDKTYVVGQVNIKRLDEANDHLVVDINIKNIEL